VRALAEKHGGTFTIESEAGRGTCAEIEIPILVPAPPHARLKSAA
jgi:signal transduction histidine kinase